MKHLALVAVLVALAATFVQGASAHSYSVKALSDVHVGKTKTELVAQKRYSGFIVNHFKSPHYRWRLMPRHATCWSHVRSRTLRQVCNHARIKYLTHRWLYGVAEKRWQKLYAPHPVVWGDPSLDKSFECIHRYEGAWTSNTGNGYYGGLQMDDRFMRTYGGALLKSKGTADNWTPSEQKAVAETAYRSGRGFGPWPNTRLSCGL